MPIIKLDLDLPTYEKLAEAAVRELRPPRSKFASLPHLPRQGSCRPGRLYGASSWSRTHQTPP
jgi:hypothetical protein